MPTLNLTAKLGIDGRGFKAGLKEAEVAAGKFGNSLKAHLGTIFTTAAAAGFVRGIAEATGRIKDLSEQTRLTTDEVQKVDHAARQSGLSFENFAQSLVKVGNARRDAVEGNDKLRATFAKYGVTLEQLNNPQLRNFDILMMLSGAMKDMTITAREQTDITDMLGERSAKLLTVLQDLSKVKPPEMFTEETINRIDRAEKAWARFKTSMQVRAADIFDYVDNREAVEDDMFGTLGGTREFRDRMAQPLTKEEIEAANAAKRERLRVEALNLSKGLYTIDADKKEKAEPVKALRGFSSRAVGGERMGAGLSGFGASGGFSAGLTNFDPSLFIEQGQLVELKAIRAGISQLERIIARGGSNDRGSGFRR